MRLSSEPPKPTAGASPTGRRIYFYVWVVVILTVAVLAVVLGWHAKGGTPTPGMLPRGQHLTRTAAVLDTAILVFREGLETILVLAAVLASFLGSNKVYRRPVAAGGTLALLATLGTWFAAVWLIGQLGGSGLDVQAATGIPAIIVLLVVMNWFFHRVYWTGWISHHHKRRRGLFSTSGERNTRRVLLGFGLLGFTSVYREGFEVVVFLQTIRVSSGSDVVLEGALLGLLFTAAVGVLTFGLHQKLPYKKLLIITGAMLCVVLFVMVGEEVFEMQQAGWIGTTSVGVQLPGWLGTWFSLFPNVETIAAQVGALGLVIGSYFFAEHLRVRRPRRAGGAVALRADAPPEAASGSGRVIAPLT
ncbi:MAG: FTR1 family protein [Solirubrobacteraceae bacterium]